MPVFVVVVVYSVRGFCVWVSVVVWRGVEAAAVLGTSKAKIKAEEMKRAGHPCDVVQQLLLCLCCLCGGVCLCLCVWVLCAAFLSSRQSRNPMTHHDGDRWPGPEPILEDPNG